ncbi:hypothetical protein [Staphylococcus hominis]|uniref:hypothetical protein n=1 Tax=Staphylococcus hominis TaxID=1290 RepID=UPI002879D953|nr:hypothetical protein [Staphylococcus hominis]MDS3897951.1 hypothetical protein [Staphylococcus hominis]
MKKIKPALKVSGNVLYSKEEVKKNRQRLDLFRQFESSNLEIWLDKNLSTSDKEQKSIKEYYLMINEENPECLKEDHYKFNKLLSKIENNNSSIEKIKDIFSEILRYELFIEKLNKEELNKKLLHSMNHYIALILLINENTEMNREIKNKIKTILQFSKNTFNIKNIKIDNLKSTNKDFAINKKILLVGISESTVIVLDSSENPILEFNHDNFNEYKFQIHETDYLHFRTHPKMSELTYIEV